ncbi:MAG: hypothetical protein KDA89_17120 [Planctomycetaceae bacterium]|nr:hypothetical protein [Planctomycetaceae bacterium]
MMDDNPFQAPRSVEPVWQPEGSGQRSPTRGVIMWTALFAANLPLPVLFGCMIARGPARLGMLSVMVLLYAGGAVLSYNRPTRSGWLFVGSAAVAISQLVPVLHIVSGAIALEAAVAVQVAGPDLKGPGTTDSIAAGVLLTAVTGTLLLSAAAVAGMVMTTIYRMLRAKPPEWSN